MGTRACGREAELGRGIRQEAACWACQGQEHGVAGGPRIARRGAEKEDKNGLGARVKQLKQTKAGPDNRRGAWETSAKSTCGQGPPRKRPGARATVGCGSRHGQTPERGAAGRMPCPWKSGKGGTEDRACFG